MMNRYYFLHIPKTAGSSLNRFLESRFEKSEIFPPHDWSDALQFGSNEIEAYRLFRGHFYHAFIEYAQVSMRSFTFLRNPLERALSHFGHIWQDPRHYFHSRARALGSLEAQSTAARLAEAGRTAGAA